MRTIACLNKMTCALGSKKQPSVIQQLLNQITKTTELSDTQEVISVDPKCVSIFQLSHKFRGQAVQVMSNGFHCEPVIVNVG